MFGIVTVNVDILVLDEPVLANVLPYYTQNVGTP